MWVQMALMCSARRRGPSQERDRGLRRTRGPVAARLKMWHNN